MFIEINHLPILLTMLFMEDIDAFLFGQVFGMCVDFVFIVFHDIIVPTGGRGRVETYNPYWVVRRRTKLNMMRVW